MGVGARKEQPWVPTGRPSVVRGEEGPAGSTAGRWACTGQPLLLTWPAPGQGCRRRRQLWGWVAARASRGAVSAPGMKVRPPCPPPRPEAGEGLGPEEGWQAESRGTGAVTSSQRLQGKVGALGQTPRMPRGSLGPHLAQSEGQRLSDRHLPQQSGAAVTLPRRRPREPCSTLYHPSVKSRYRASTLELHPVLPPRPLLGAGTSKPPCCCACQGHLSAASRWGQEPPGAHSHDQGLRDQNPTRPGDTKGPASRGRSLPP